MPTPVIRAVTFDAGDTLVYLSPSFGAVFAEVCAMAGVVLSPVQQEAVGAFIFERMRELQQRGGRFSTSIDESRAFWQTSYHAFLTEIGADAATQQALPAQLYDTFTDVARYQLFDDARPVLEWLRQRDVRIGLVSNWESWLERLIRHLDLEHYFDFVVISGVVGIEKPDPRIFAEVIRLSGVAPEEILHVGDSPSSDFAGARSVGMHAVLLDRDDRHSHLSPRVRRLSELTAPAGLLSHLPGRS